MSGSKLTVKSSDEMRAARERGESRSNWDDVRRRVREGIEPETDPDAPDATALLQEEIARRRAGRPAGSGNKEQISIRLDRSVLAAFRSTGTGWQTRVNDALADWLKHHSPNQAGRR
jgi:uncharacterized protein (DUF4415 family)